MNIVKLQKEQIKKDLKLENNKSALLLNTGENSSILEVVSLDCFGDFHYFTYRVRNDKIKEETERVKNTHKNIVNFFEVSYERLPSKLIENVSNNRIIFSIFDDVKYKRKERILNEYNNCLKQSRH